MCFLLFLKHLIKKMKNSMKAADQLLHIPDREMSPGSPADVTRLPAEAQRGSAM